MNHPAWHLGSDLTRRRFLRMSSSLALVTTAFPIHGDDSSSRLKAAVIGHTGFGDYGHGLETIFTGRKGIELVAVADPDPAGRARVAAKIGAPRRYANYRDLLAEERPQLVSIASRHAEGHHAVALAALRAGAHIYCETPFTTSCAEADELLEEAEGRGLRIAVAHTMRMMPIVLRLKQGIAEGLLGELVEARAYGKQDSRAGGEDMMVLGSHLFDLLRLFFGNPITCSARVLTQGRELKVSDRRLVKDNVGLVAGDEVFAQFAFAKGVNATFTSSSRLRETVGHWGIELLGSKGVARINCDIEPNVFLRRTAPWTAQGRADAWEPLSSPVPTQRPESVSNPVSDWLEAIREKRDPECSGRNGAWAVEMVMGVYCSALQRTRITFPLQERNHPLRPV